MKKEININFNKYLKQSIDYNGKKIKLYGILDWVYKNQKGINLDWLDELGINYVNTIHDLPKNSGIYVTGYDSDIDELNEVKKKGIPVIENPCPWVRNLRNQILETDSEKYQVILMILKGHLVYECYKSAFPDDIIIINPDNYKEKIFKYKNKKPYKLISYTTYRKIDVQNVITFMNKYFPHEKNIMESYKKTLCFWTRQGIFSEISIAVKNHSLTDIWIICSSEKDVSTTSLIREIKDNNANPVIIKKEKDIPSNIDFSQRIGVLAASMPVPEKVKTLKNKIKDLYHLNEYINK